MREFQQRFIPAGAGNTTGVDASLEQFTGSSPLARGTRQARAEQG